MRSDDYAAAVEILQHGANWNQPAGRSYFIAPVVADTHPLLVGCRRGFFVRIPPGGNVHPHRDESAAKVFETDHIVIETNDKSFIYWNDSDDGQTRRVHLEQGRRYRVVDRGVLHWAVNDGTTDRVHLLIEYLK